MRVGWKSGSTTWNQRTPGKERNRCAMRESERMDGVGNVLRDVSMLRGAG